MGKREKDGCNECDRKGVLKCLDEAEEHLPDNVSGFGAHDDYVMGLVDGARAAIRGVRSEIEKLHKEALEFGLPKESTEQVTEMVGKHLEKQTQLDLDMKPAEYPVGVEEESYTVLTFECGSWTLKVREDRLQRAAEDDKVLALVQRRLKASSDLYPLSEGEFDRWVQRFTRSLEKYVRTGCA